MPTKAKPPAKPNKLRTAFTEALRSAWRTQARVEQLAPPGDWTWWVFCGGRGSGKTRSGSEWVCERVAAGARYIHLIAPTVADCRDVLLEGPAGILSIAPSHDRPTYQPSLRKVTWPSGAQALLFSADEPDRLRGPQCDSLWIDELCAMRSAQDVLDMASFGLRLGKDPRALVTSTPRPTKPFKQLLAREGLDVVVTRSSSYANRANLAPAFFNQILAKYQGTRLGRQEILAELLTDTPGALFHLEKIEELRVSSAPPCERIVVSLDPAITYGPDSDETGIVVVGLANGHAYVIDDASGRYPPEEWASIAINVYRKYFCDRIVGETNQGGALIESTLRAVDPSIPFRAVHAARGKLTRAEPVAAIYEQNRAHHVGQFAALEDQMCTYDGSRSGLSPDRLDALVWAVHDLMLQEPAGNFIKEASFLTPSSTVDGTPAPVEIPQRVDCVLASIAAGLPLEPDTLAIVFFAASVYQTANPPLVILDWNLCELHDNTLDSFITQAYARLEELAQATRVRCGINSGLLIDNDGLAEILIDVAMSRDYLVNPLQGSIVERPHHERAIRAAAFLNQRKVRICREAHAKELNFRGVTRNHLLAQALAFGATDAAKDVQPLLVALSNGILECFSDAELRARAA